MISQCFATLTLISEAYFVYSFQHNVFKMSPNVAKLTPASFHVIILPGWLQFCYHLMFYNHDFILSLLYEY